MVAITVVGGGVAGCASALALARAGHTVRLVERDGLLAGASGAALGGLFGYTARVQTRLAGVQRASVAAWPAFALDLAALSGVAVGDFYRDWGGVGQVHVGLMAEVFGRALAACGVDVVVGEGESVEGPVVWCAGWGNARWFEGMMEVVEGQALKVRGAVDRPVYGGDMYVVPGWAEDEVLVGSSKARLAAPREGVVREEITTALLQQAGVLVPGLERAEVLDAWVGHRPSLKRGLAMLPLVRPVAPRVWAVAPLGGMGWCLAPAVRDAVAALGDL